MIQLPPMPRGRIPQRVSKKGCQKDQMHHVKQIHLIVRTLMAIIPKNNLQRRSAKAIVTPPPQKDTALKNFEHFPPAI
jgi:hypothetical protein